MTGNDLTIKQKQIIFKARTGMLPVGFNFGKKIPCFACEMDDDTDSHLLNCFVLKLLSPEMLENSNVSIEDVYSTDMKKVLKCSKMLLLAIRMRKLVKENNETK